jgi:hypothetical protein
MIENTFFRTIKWSSLPKGVNEFIIKFLYELKLQELILLRNFWSKFNHSFSKLDHFRVGCKNVGSYETG